MKHIIVCITCLFTIFGFQKTKAALESLDDTFPRPPRGIVQVGVQCDDDTFFFDCWLLKGGYLETRDKVFIMMPFTQADEVPLLAGQIAGNLATLTDTETDYGKMQILQQVMFTLNPPPPPLPLAIPLPPGLPAALMTGPMLPTFDGGSAAQGG